MSIQADRVISTDATTMIQANIHRLSGHGTRRDKMVFRDWMVLRDNGFGIDWELIAKDSSPSA
jgi:hypothetical protein